MVNFYKQKAFNWSLVAFLFLATWTSAIAQSSVVNGVIKSGSDGEPLPGVTVLIKGTTTGTVSDIDGAYSIDVSSVENPVLVFTFIGYKSTEMEVNNRSSIDVDMEDDVTALEEVVVIGYGVQQKKLLTGATGQVSGSDITRLSTTGSLEALQGQIAGVNIASTSGQPGEGMRVTIRGAGTIGSAGPLYVVDGVQTGDISYLNNADIESIDVLKDAASAAIYGSQAANGVVLITTKTGRPGKAKFSFDAYYGLQEPSNQIRMLNSREYATIMNEAAINTGKLPHFTSSELAAMGEGTDWIDQMMYENAPTQNYVLGVSGGNETSVYSISGSFTTQDGIVGGSGLSEYMRTGLRVNTEHRFFDDILKVGQHLTFAYTKKNGIAVGNQYSNTLRGAFNTSPFLPVYDDNGAFFSNVDGTPYNGMPWSPWAEGESNPYAEMVLNNQNDNNNQKMLGDIYVELQPIKGLRLRSRFGFDYYGGESRSYRPAYYLSEFSQRLNGDARQELNKGLALTFDNTVTYDMEFGDHNLSVMGGTFAYVNNGSNLSVTNAGLTISDLEHAYIDNTTNTDLALLSFSGGPNTEQKLLSYFGRLSYNFNEKYLLNATFRADGSSRFAPENQWGYFPSVSAGWVVSNESFMSATTGVVNFLKLRASWGQVGNQNVTAYQYLSPIQIGSAIQVDGVTFNDGNYYFGSSDFDAAGNAIGAYPFQLANPDVKWETSEQLNVGIDANLINDKLSLNVDWYKKTTKDWLVQAPGYATEGARAPVINGGNVENTGIELSATWRDQIGDVNFFVTAVGAKNKNNVTEVPTEDGIIHGLANQLYDNASEFYRRAETGYPVGYFWGYTTAGIFQTSEEVASNTNSEGQIIQPNALPGDVRYVDQNDDGVISDDDKGMIGDPNPDYTYSLSVGFDYKGFDFLVYGYGVAGNQIVQSYRNHANGTANYTKAILGRWHGEGTSNTTPRVTETNVNYQFSDIMVQNGDFFRINNVTAGYDFSKLVKGGFFSKLRLYASVLNAFTFTEYDGMDPEVGYGLENGSSGVSDGSSGIDVGFYPRPRTYLLGLNVNF